MTMPQMTGLMLSEQLKRVRPDIPVIVCTENSPLMDKETSPRKQSILIRGLAGFNCYTIENIFAMQIQT